ncbi:succinate dehydrogenase, hydrophobic membrane anchor protein [Candidatus Vallotia lariciata]|uniref:succinate dehydrogenase, hydrophobic membrane anchor protein n=1 Tax=Candidatus Vallotia laricis TaxID=2018052 RepID=UPI001D01F49D|nr:succinate dehydrogenase, hydrophobic membrane anchor protein [Candidatus Vallotia lariciata]UDG82954.1 Succinate dehydrogenase hydrophobic membrane anchor subunit [Candidatus Vallotia lariciata]
MNHRIGAKRLVVGAHYGLYDWIMQRATAATMAIYTVILLIYFFSAGNFSYKGWTAIFSMQWMRLATFITFIALFYHAWVGVRNIWMDYIKQTGVRLILYVLTIAWLLACAGYAAQILWRV